jgi:hypothetical protein
VFFVLGKISKGSGSELLRKSCRKNIREHLKRLQEGYFGSRDYEYEFSFVSFEEELAKGKLIIADFGLSYEDFKKFKEEIEKHQLLYQNEFKKELEKDSIKRGDKVLLEFLRLGGDENPKQIALDIKESSEKNGYSLSEIGTTSEELNKYIK